MQQLHVFGPCAPAGARLSFLQCFSCRNQAWNRVQIAILSACYTDGKTVKTINWFCISFPARARMNFVNCALISKVSVRDFATRDTPRVLRVCVNEKQRRMPRWNSPYKHHVQNAMRSTTTGRKTNFGLIEMLARVAFRKALTRWKSAALGWIGNAKLPARRRLRFQTLWIAAGQNIYICGKCTAGSR